MSLTEILIFHLQPPDEILTSSDDVTSWQHQKLCILLVLQGGLHKTQPFGGDQDI